MEQKLPKNMGASTHTHTENHTKGGPAHNITLHADLSYMFQGCR